ncbi:MAG: chorismate mutase [Pseudomonadota bacterium]
MEKTIDPRQASDDGEADKPASLARLRARLDVIDAELHKLLRERFAIVEDIGRAKGPGEPIIRPAREAAVLENRLANHDGAMPPEVIAFLWRTIISTACALQRPFTVHTIGLTDAARFLYGPVPLQAAASPHAMIAALHDNPGDVGLAPEDVIPWAHCGEAHVIARFELSNGRIAVALGGANVSPGTGPLAVILRDDKAIAVWAHAVEPDDKVLGRVHPFPLIVPVVEF